MKKSARSSGLPEAKQRNKDRKPENTTATISLPREQLEALKARARMEHRSVSNLLQVIIEQERIRYLEGVQITPASSSSGDNPA